MVPNVIFCCCIKDCGIENHEFAVLIITLGVFSVFSDFPSGFSVLVKILAGFSVFDRPQCPPPHRHHIIPIIYNKHNEKRRDDAQSMRDTSGNKEKKNIMAGSTSYPKLHG